MLPNVTYTNGMTHEERQDKLSPVQRKFVDEYLKDPSDGGLAYMRAAGTTNKKSGSVQASKLLKMEKVQAALKARAKSTLGLLEARVIQNVEFWLEIRDNVENRPADRMKASENLGKYMQMFVEKKEIKSDIQVQIVDDIR